MSKNKLNKKPKVFINTNSDHIKINEDKLKFLLTKFAHSLNILINPFTYLSLCLTLSIPIFTSNFKYELIEHIFWIFSICFLILFIIFLILYIINRGDRSINNLINKIKGIDDKKDKL